jgi:DNA-binding response OmpR family regulator
MEEVQPLSGRRILVIEDDYLVAQMLTNYLEDAGAVVIGPLGWIDETLAFIENNLSAFDIALLDLNLHGKKSYEIADLLVKRNIAFVFASGYGADGIEGEYRRYPRCTKPFNRLALLAALAE